MRSCSHSSLRLWMVWLLCLCAWRGPVPVVHCHTIEALGLADVDANWQLAEHLSACHACADEGDETGWHVHFILPSPAGQSRVPHELPADRPVLSELITHDAEGTIPSTVRSSVRPAMCW